MPLHIAFLRAINVGGHVVKMDRLRALFAELGQANVETFIASGNVVFESRARDAAALERRIERHLHDALGWEVATFLRTPAEVTAAATYAPAFPDGDDGKASLYVGFLRAAPAPAAAAELLALRSDIDDFAVHGREAYWRCRTLSTDSRFSGAVLERVLGMPATLRNVTTVRKLAAKYPPA